MPGLGAAEILVIVIVVSVLFGAPLLTFLMGYALGKARASSSESPSSADPSRAASEPVAADSGTTASITPPKEPTHE